MRAALYFLVWMQLFSGGISLAKAPEDCAKSAFKSLFQEPVQTEKLTETVDLLYYPKAGYLFISHVELGVKDKVWQTLVRASEKGSLSAAERKAMQGGRAFYRFRLKASPDEVGRLEQLLEKSKDAPRIQTCVSGACKALNRAGVLYIPPPFSKVPLLSAAYLRILKLAGARRVVSVHFFGKSQIRSLIALEIMSEAMMVGNFFSGGGLLIEWIDEKGHKFLEWISIEEKPESGH